LLLASTATTNLRAQTKVYERLQRWRGILPAVPLRVVSRESRMKRFALAVIGTVMATSVLAAPKSCEELKAEIEAKIQANNVSSYTLEIVGNDEVHDQNMVVGTCDNGTKKIIYQKNDR
jgi:uncharacterized membrane protein